MDVNIASGVLKLLKEGGLLGALVLALGVIAFMWRENKALTQQVFTEKDAHRLTAEKLSVMSAKTAELMERLLERRARAPRQAKARPEGGGSPPTG